MFTQIIRPFSIYVANYPRKAVPGCVPQGAVPRATLPVDASLVIRPQGNLLRGADMTGIQPQFAASLGAVSANSAATAPGGRRLQAVLPGQQRTAASMAPTGSVTPEATPVAAGATPSVVAFDGMPQTEAAVRPPAAAPARGPAGGLAPAGALPAAGGLAPAGAAGRLQASANLPARLGPEYFLTPDPNTCCGADCGTLYGALDGNVVASATTTSPAECCTQCKGESQHYPTALPLGELQTPQIVLLRPSVLRSA